MDRIEELLASYREEMMETVQKWVRIPSVKGEPAPGAPFGGEIRRALDAAMEDCSAFGLRTQIFDGYAGHADLGEGDTRDALAILAHLDVVPVGDGWQREPFGAQREDGKIFGRGTSDDKGPAVAALYALRAVKEAGVPLRRKVRLILGCDEECGSSDMAYYKKTGEMPRSGFSPDADYPVINIEKGGCHLKFAGDLSPEGLQVLSMQVGERANVIPGFASALVEGDEETARKAMEAGERLGFPVTATLGNGAVIIETVGVTGHAAFPGHGRNAIGQMLLLFRELGVQGVLRDMADAVGMTWRGENLGIDMRDGVSGELTASLDIIRVEGGRMEALMDIRYPVLLNLDAMVDTAKMRLPDVEITVAGSRPPHFVSERTELVQELLEAYHEVTGGEKRTVAIGGGTYAQSLEEGVAFGALFPGEPEMAHQANEYMTEESIFQNARIFARAIVRLAGKNSEEDTDGDR
ncbi:MAG: Sapep family Mn(2+)-dependent dipeptidase [Clostridia bacterium]|nr:Sapep family Mn(2+)-dependent dipeptidase [Clostridia bacterium]